MRDDLRTLWRSDAAARIAVTATPAPDGYAIAFDVTPTPRVVQVELDGVTRAEVPRLAALEGTLHDDARLVRLVTATQTALREHGYLDASLTATTRTTCAGIVVRVAGTLGQRYRVGALRVLGAAEPVALAELEDDLGHANVPGGTYWSDNLDTAMLRVLARHQQLGYFDTKGHIEAVPDEQTGRVAITVQIDDGPRYRIEVAITGGTPAMRALAAVRLATVDGTHDLRGLQRALTLLDAPLATLGGRIALTCEPLRDVYRVHVALAPDVAARPQDAP